MVQKIFFVHVPIAWVAFLAFFVTFVFSILFLVTRKRLYDTYAYISAEIGVVFTTLVLITGMIWAKSSWNTWWAWEPRLTTSLILWFIYLAYIMIRQMDGVWEKKARLVQYLVLLVLLMYRLYSWQFVGGIQNFIQLFLEKVLIQSGGGMLQKCLLLCLR